MREGWLLSEGEVIASAVEDRSRVRSLAPVRGARPLEAVLVVRALPLLWAGRAHERLSIGHLSGGVLVRVSPLRAWRPVLRPRAATDAVIAPSIVFELAGIAPGDQLEFRATR